jgi:hypothetical protein
MTDEKRTFIHTNISNPKAWDVISRSADILTLNKVVFNLAERVKKLEDALLKVVELSMIMEDRIMVLEAKLEPAKPSDMN